MDANYRNILALNERYSTTSQLFYFNDTIEGDLETGTETFSFSAILNDKTGTAMVGGNYVLINDAGKNKLFQIMISEQDVSTQAVVSVYCENIGMELLNKVFRRRPSQALNIRQFLELVLSETDWSVGEVDDTIIDFETIDFDSDLNIFALIHQNIQSFGAEVEFEAKIENNILVKRVNIYTKRGKLYTKRLEIERNTNSIGRKVDYTNIATALIGVGSDNIKFNNIEVESIDKPIGQDFVADMDAYERYNLNGEHIFRVYKYDTDSEHELLRKTYEALKEYTVPKVTYEIDASIFNDIYANDFNRLDYGDTFKITDYNFVPPLFLEARVGSLKKSKTNATGTVTFTNFRELVSEVDYNKYRLIADKKVLEEKRFVLLKEKEDILSQVQVIKINEGLKDTDELSNLIFSETEYTDSIDKVIEDIEEKLGTKSMVKYIGYSFDDSLEDYVEKLKLLRVQMQQANNKIANNVYDLKTVEDIFNKLTDNGKQKAIIHEDGEIYINATYIKSGILNGIRVISELDGRRVEVYDGYVNFYDGDTKIGSVGYDNQGSGGDEESTDRLWLATHNGYALKLQSDGNMSLEADGTIYLNKIVATVFQMNELIGSIIPKNNAEQNLGSESKRFDKLWATRGDINNLYAYNLSANGATLHQVSPNSSTSSAIGSSSNPFLSMEAKYIWWQTNGGHSDVRRKENIKPVQSKEILRPINNEALTLEDMYNFVDNDLNLFTYNYKDIDEDGQLYNQLGFIANDLVNTKVGSKFIEENDDIGEYIYNNGYYQNIIAGALKESIKKQKDLENKIDELMKFIKDGGIDA
ncbi:MAG: phage tail spike protein [Paraclostridium sp.]